MYVLCGVVFFDLMCSQVVSRSYVSTRSLFVMFNVMCSIVFTVLMSVKSEDSEVAK